MCPRRVVSSNNLRYSPPYTNILPVASLYSTLFFAYATQVFMLGRSKSLITLDQLPILPASLRAAVNLSEIKYVIRNFKVPFGNLMRPGSGFQLSLQVIRANFGLISVLQLVSVVTAIAYYAPIFFIQYFLAYLEQDPERKNTSWGWFYVGGIFVSYFVLVLGRIVVTHPAASTANIPRISECPALVFI